MNEWPGKISDKELADAGVTGHSSEYPGDFDVDLRRNLRERAAIKERAFSVPHVTSHPPIVYPEDCPVEDWYTLTMSANAEENPEQVERARRTYAEQLQTAYKRRVAAGLKPQLDYLLAHMQQSGLRVPVAVDLMQRETVRNIFHVWGTDRDPLDEKTLYLYGRSISAGIRCGFYQDEFDFVHDTKLFEQVLDALGDRAKDCSVYVEIKPLYKVVSNHGVELLETIVQGVDRYEELRKLPGYEQCVGVTLLERNPLSFLDTQPYLLEQLVSIDPETFIRSMSLVQRLRAIDGYEVRWYERGLSEMIGLAVLVGQHSEVLSEDVSLEQYVRENNLLDATPNEIVLYSAYAQEALPLTDEDRRYARSKKHVMQVYAHEQLPGLSDLCERLGLNMADALPGTTYSGDITTNAQKAIWPIRYLIEHPEMQEAIISTFDVTSFEQLSEIVETVLARRVDKIFPMQVRATEGLYCDELGEGYAGIRGTQFLRAEKEYDHEFLDWMRNVHREIGINFVKDVETAPYAGEGILRTWRRWFDHPNDYALAKEHGLFANETCMNHIPCEQMLEDPETASFVRRFGQLPILQGAAQGLAVPSELTARVAPWVANPEYLDVLLEHGVVGSERSPKIFWERLTSTALLTLAQEEGYRAFVQEYMLIDTVCQSETSHENTYAWYQDKPAKQVAVELGLFRVGQNSSLPEHEKFGVIRNLSPEQLEEIQSLVAVQSVSSFVLSRMPQIVEAVLNGRSATLATFVLLVEDGQFDSRDDLSGFPISKENLLSYLDDTPLFDIHGDATYPGDPKPWSRAWFAEDEGRKRYLTREIVGTVQKFGTVVGLALYEKADNVDAFRGHYEDVVGHMTRDSERRTVLQLGEMFSIAIHKGNFDFFDSFCEREPCVSETFRSFTETHQVGKKGETLLTLLFASAVNMARQTETDAGIHAVVGAVYERVQRYQEVLDTYRQEQIPEGLRVSVGMEYEVTKSIASAYTERTASNYKADIETLSCYSGIARGSDAVHEIATEPTDNPYALLLELKLLEELDFVDLNFSHSGYDRGSRSYHITFGGESGILCDQYANLCQNGVLMADLGGISAGAEVRCLNKYDNIRQRGRNNQPVFGSSTHSVEYRSLSIDRAEPFERAVVSMFDLHIAKQALDRYATIEPGWIEDLTPEALIDLSAFQTQSQRDGVVNETLKDSRAWELLFAYVRYQRELVDAMKGHMYFFQEEALSGTVPDEVGQLSKGWIEGGKQSKVLFAQQYDMNLLSLVSIAESAELDEVTWYKALEGAQRDAPALTERERRMLFLWFKKYIREPVRDAQESGNLEELQYYAQLLDQPNGSEEIARRARNTDAFNGVLAGTHSDRDDFMRKTNFVSPDLYGRTDAELVNKLTRIHNMYLKPPTQQSFSADSVNALAVFETTREDDDVAVTDGDASKRTVFDSVDRNLVQRNGPYVIQGSGEGMVVNRAQRALLAFRRSVRSALRNE